MQYSTDVLIGTWIERRQLFAYQKQKFIEEYNEGKSGVQYARTLRGNLSKPVTLGGGTSSIHIGDRVQIIAPDVAALGKSSLGVALEATVPSGGGDAVDLHTGCPLLASSATEPTSRNVWRIRDAEGHVPHAETCLNMGDPFTIALASTEGGPLYIGSITPAINLPNESPMGSPVALSSVLSRFCIFKAVHVDKTLRNETEGTAVAPFQKFAIVHATSNLDLCAERKMPVPTVFGGAMTVSFRNLNTAAGETTENLWMFKTQSIADRNLKRYQGSYFPQPFPEGTERECHPSAALEQHSRTDEEISEVCEIPRRPRAPGTELPAPRTPTAIAKSSRKHSSEFEPFKKNEAWPGIPEYRSAFCANQSPPRNEEDLCVCRPFAPCPYVKKIATPNS